MKPLTVQLHKQLAAQCKDHISKVKKIIKFTPVIIADIGANVGHYAYEFLSSFPEAEIHSYEPHPDNLLYLNELKDDRLHIHEYGLFLEDRKASIGMRNDGKHNNGTYSIHLDSNATEVTLKNANNEIIRPDFVKMDIEGSEYYVLQCNDFFSQTKAILIELVYLDNFGQNDSIRLRLNEMGFKFSEKISKNDELWIKN